MPDDPGDNANVPQIAQDDSDSGPHDLSPRAIDMASRILEAMADQDLGNGDLAEILVEKSVMKSHSGPLPAPEDLENYDRVMPGLAERIVARAEREQLHRHKVAEGLLDREFRLRSKGQTYGLVSLVIMLLVVGFLAWLGFGTEAAALGTATIVGVVSVFVLGRRSDPNLTTDES